MSTEPTLRAYPKIFHFGHRAVTEVLHGPVEVQEKTDGSQLSFGVKAGVFTARSRSVTIDPDAPPKLFAPAIEHLRQHAALMPEGTVFRGEAICTPRHNTLAYDRTPRGFVMLFDVDEGGEHYADAAARERWAEVLGIEAVPVLYEGMVDGLPSLEAMLQHVSVLGGQKIEGVVVKNYARFGEDGHALLAKLVSAEFKETHRGVWKAEHPGQKAILDQLVEDLRTVPRWRKTVQHLRDAGLLAGEPCDIGPLLKELSADVEAEEQEAIKEALYRWARKDLLRGIARGFAEWYKGELTKGPVEAFVPAGDGGEEGGGNESA